MNETPIHIKNTINELGNVKRAKTQTAIDGRRRKAKLLLMVYEPTLTTDEVKHLKDYLKELNTREKEIKIIDSAIERDGRMEFESEDLQRINNYNMNDLQHNNSTSIELNNREETERNEQNTAKIHRTQNEDLSKLMSGIYIKGMHPQPEQKTPLITFKNQSFLTLKNLSIIIASPGMGKSSICESILASNLNNDCDSLGFKIGDEVKTALFFDCERDYSLVDVSTQRMERRAGEVVNEGRTSLIIGMRELFTTKQKKEKILHLIEYYEPQLLMIDGIADLMVSPNSEEETTQIYSWLIELITKYNLSILTTIHPNWGSKKARGHLGSEMLRRCEGVLIVTENVDKTVKTISTEKARSSAPVKHSFHWSNKEGNNVTCEDLTAGAIKKPPLYYCLTREQLKELKISYLVDLGNGEQYQQLTYKEIESTLKQIIEEDYPHFNSGTNAIKILISDLVKYDYLIKEGKAPKTTYTFALNENDKLRDLVEV